MFLYPHCYTPTAEARQAAETVMTEVHSYMTAHPESELHRRGKMFGVLVVETPSGSPCTGVERVCGEVHYLTAFSGVLDGSYRHEGFVEPIYEIDPQTIVGTSREDSQQKQQWLFEQYKLLNAKGERKTVMQLWREGGDGYQYGGFKSLRAPGVSGSLPPAGTGECCAPKLLQAAYIRGLKPLAMAEFWIGASPKDEIRAEGQFYPACIAKCRPLLQHMLRGIEVEENPLVARGKALAKDIRTLYEDEDILVVSKPSGLLTVPGKEEQYSLEEALRDENENENKNEDENRFLKATHRLDMDTSGLVVLAKNEAAYVEMQRQFAAHEVTKTYRAILEVHSAKGIVQNGVHSAKGIVHSVSCAMDGGEGVIELPLLANPLDRPRQIVDWQHGKRAVTRWRQLAGSLIELYPETGRTHQLRVHCAHPDGLGRPIAGDRLYGTEGERLMLHAWRIVFAHPRTHVPIDITDQSPLFQQP